MERTEYIDTLLSRLQERRKFIQVLAGPRQVGKTTILRDLLAKVDVPYISVNADMTAIVGPAWLESTWNSARRLLREGKQEALLVIDEIQYVPAWSECVKKLWDEDTQAGLNLKVILSGSSRLLLRKGLTESLAGRFELIPVSHWSFPEMREAFGLSLEEYVYFGGYPGAGDLIHDEGRWLDYIRFSIIEPSISKDITKLEYIRKPVLLQQAFELSCMYSAQILPYSRMLGQLVEAGNATTVAGYIDLLDQNGLVGGIGKYSGSQVKIRASSPKLQVHDNAFYSVVSGYSFSDMLDTPDRWGRTVESAVGAHLKNNERQGGYKLYYWREGNDEVDFVLEKGRKLAALEVKSGRKVMAKGLSAFLKRYPEARLHTLSYQSMEHSGVISLEEFLCSDPTALLS